MKEEYLDFSSNESRSSTKSRYKAKLRQDRFQKTTDGNGFECVHCHYFVYSEPLLSGVQNRNHCPNCLWSRHMDLYKAGDRLAACKAQMKPVGLTLKKTKKKYGSAGFGELMLVHICTDCGKVSINRIAADDRADVLFEVYQRSFELDDQTRDTLQQCGIQILIASDRHLVQEQISGRS